MADIDFTTAPITNASMSTKLASIARRKYSSAMLRPPATAITPSAMKSLLCMRWLSRPKSKIDAV